jgi:hypothetical protein
MRTMRAFGLRRRIWRVRRSVPRVVPQPLSALLPAFAAPKRPILLVGCPRSGTSILLRALLQSSELRSVQSEGHILWDAYHHPRDRGWDSDATVEVSEQSTTALDSPRDVLDAVLAATSSSHIRDSALGAAPPEFLENGYGGTWVFFVVDAPSTHGPSAIRAVWEGVLVAGAFRDGMHRAGLPPPEGYGVSIRLPDGSTEPHSAWPFGNIAYGQRFRSADSRGAAESEIRAGISQSRLPDLATAQARVKAPNMTFRPLYEKLSRARRAVCRLDRLSQSRGPRTRRDLETWRGEFHPDPLGL